MILSPYLVDGVTFGLESKSYFLAYLSVKLPFVE